MLKTVTNSVDASQIQTPITLPDDVTLSTGNLVIGTSGKGIDFSATPGTGTSELLDDYEEGDWTPGQGAGLTVVGTFSSSGSYTKIGNMVYVKGLIAGSTTVAAGGGSEMLTGLPFTALANSVGVAGNAGFSTTFGVRVSGTALNAITGVIATASIAFTISYQV
jgi:hypothetical protein